MIHPDTELRPADARVGYGVFATQRILRFAEAWDHEAVQAVRAAPTVPQPLAQLFDGSPALSRALSAAARGEEVVLPSCRDFVFP